MGHLVKPEASSDPQSPRLYRIALLSYTAPYSTLPAGQLVKQGEQAPSTTGWCLPSLMMSRRSRPMKAVDEHDRRSENPDHGDRSWSIDVIPSPDVARPDSMPPPKVGVHRVDHEEETRN
eukprot:scaffold1387_cov260-Pinguiococcus_pyrenoidosus.AAC.3